MALFRCPECQGQVSDRAAACPHCGMPVAQENSSAIQARSHRLSRPMQGQRSANGLLALCFLLTSTAAIWYLSPLFAGASPGSEREPPIESVSSLPPAAQSPPTKAPTHNSQLKSKISAITPSKDLVALKAKVKRLIGKGSADFLLYGELTNEPRMMLVILREEWRRFTKRERVALRALLEEKIADMRVHPDLYTVNKEGSYFWDSVLDHLANIQPAVMISDGKYEGALQLDYQIDDFDKGPEK